jgi:hypothetical protein
MYKGNPEIQFENSGKGKIIAIEWNGFYCA